MSSVDFLSRMTFFLLRKKNHIAIGMASIFALGYLFFEGIPFQNKIKQPSLGELLTSKDKSSFEKGFLEAKKHPQTAQAYAGTIAQRLITENRGAEAFFFLKQASSNLDGNFSEFVNISSKIASNNMKEALVDVYRFKNKLDSQKDTSSILYPLTLLRISLLEKELKHPDKELLVLNELEKFLQEKSHRNFASMALGSSNKPTLIDYIAFRKNKLN